MIATPQNTRPAEPAESSLEGQSEHSQSSTLSSVGPTPEEVESAEDEEVRIAMEMAMAAAQNPGLSADALRKLVAGKNKQMEMVDEVKKKKEEEKLKQKVEAQKRWNEKKEKAISWWKSKAEAASQAASDLKAAAEVQTQSLLDQSERRKYWDVIRRDEEIQETRNKMKQIHKVIKAHRLQGNREETRHLFKRQKMQNNLNQLNTKLEKNQVLLTETQFNVHEYAKAMMRASKIHGIKTEDNELALEAQLCRNMHQMLVIDKQKSKVKKTSKEIKKYLQRCKSWLTDKKAFCEKNTMTLSATNISIIATYEDTLARQDALIAKFKAMEEFKDVEMPETHPLDFVPDRPGIGATLEAFRRLDTYDSIRLRREQKSAEKEKEEKKRKAISQRNLTKEVEKSITKQIIGQKQAAEEQAKARRQEKSGGKPELYIEAKDDVSVHSNLSDPDDPDDTGFDVDEDTSERVEASESEVSGVDFSTNEEGDVMEQVDEEEQQQQHDEEDEDDEEVENEDPEPTKAKPSAASSATEPTCDS